MAVATTMLKPKRQPIQEQVTPFSSFSLRRFSVDEYHKMIEFGVLKSGEPFELLRGWIVKKMSIISPHSQAVSRLQRWFSRHLSDEWYLRTQQPITTSDSEPEPDLVVAQGPDTLYDSGHPTPAQAALVIEVASSSLLDDQTEKLRIYADSGVSQYWIINLIDMRVEVYTQPRGGKKPGYKSCVHYAKGEEIPLVLAKKKVGSLPVSEFLA